MLYVGGGLFEEFHPLFAIINIIHLMTGLNELC